MYVKEVLMIISGRSVGVVSPNYMVPMKISYPTQSPLLIHKESFKYLTEKVRFTILNLGNPLQVCHIIVLMPDF